jgi:hypothetical protein
MDFTGRPMPGMLYLGPAAVAEDARLRSWIAEAAAFADAPPPPKKAKAKAKL